MTITIGEYTTRNGCRAIVDARDGSLYSGVVITGGGLTQVRAWWNEDGDVRFPEGGWKFRGHVDFSGISWVFESDNSLTRIGYSESTYNNLMATPSPFDITKSNAPSNVHFLSQTDDWATPKKFFDAVNAEHGPFELDVCATPENAKCPRHYTKEDDGLKQPWVGKCWMNPPYGRVIGDWMRKAYESAQSGATVVCLVPARTDTAWWHDYAAKGQVIFIRGRLKFGNGKNSAPFPSALVIFKTHN